MRISDGDEQGKKDLNSLEMNDAEVFAMLSRGEVAGVFQLSGYACKKLCVEMGVKSFDDMVAITALSRPGPSQSGQTADYLLRKKTGRWEQTPYSEYNDIVENTYGVLVYQEQVMRVFTDVAGLSASLADKIRKVIGKKRDAAEFEPYRVRFIEGCQKQKTFTEEEAERFWAGLLEWASYAFNLSHAVEYSIISYRTAWLKYHYPMEYLASFLTYGKDDQKVDVLQEVSRRIKIQLVTPKVKYSLACKWAVDGDKLHMPFTAIKGIGEKDAEKCLTAKPVAQSNGSLAGFFNLPKPETKKDLSKLQQLLEEIKAFDDDLKSAPADFDKYFGINYMVSVVGAVKLGASRPLKRRATTPVDSVTSRSLGGVGNPTPQGLSVPASAVIIPKRRIRNG